MQGTVEIPPMSDRILGAVRQASKPVPRQILSLMLPRGERPWLNRILNRLVARGVVRECCDGFLPGEAPRVLEFDGPAPALIEVPEPLRLQLAEITARAQDYGRRGCPSLAVSLLNRAAAKVEIPHVRDGLGALAALYAEPRPKAARRAA